MGIWLYARRCEILKSRIAEGPDEDEEPGMSSELQAEMAAVDNISVEAWGAFR